MTTTLPATDVVICGLGWAGSVMLQSLADSGLRIVGLERGPEVSPAPGLEIGATEQDDLASRRGRLMQDLSRETITFRHRRDQRALPMHRHGAFLQGEIVGGAGVTWNGINTRYLPHDFAFRSHLAERGWLDKLPEDMIVEDFGLGYDELEPDYAWFEDVTGTTGQAGNLPGGRNPAGNPFEGPRSSEYPLPPLPDSMAGKLFRKAAAGMGYHPYTLPATNASRDYVTPLGLKMGACVFCGFCDRFRCPVDAKGTPVNTLLNAVRDRANVDIRPNSRVLRVIRSADGTRATGVEYVTAGGEHCIQPAETVVLSGYTFSNVHLMLVSGIGTPFDPATGEGTVGKGYAYHVRGGATAFFDEDVWINSFIGSGGLGTTMDDFNAPDFDSMAHGFVGGAMIGAEASGSRPTAQTPTPSDVPRWGRAWKEAVPKHFNHTARLNVCGASMSYRGNYLSLDPEFTDAWGRPMLRLTFDFGPNEVALSNFMTDRSVEISERMGAARVEAKPGRFPFDIRSYQGSHNTGGAPMGRDPQTSAVDSHSRSWDVPNVFVVGGSSFPQLPGKNPTATIGALARRAARAVRADAHAT